MNAPGSQLGATTRALFEGSGLDVAATVDQVARALDEDLAYGPDVTTSSTVIAEQHVRARFAARRPGVLSGIAVAAVALDLVAGADAWVMVDSRQDGDRVGSGDAAMEVEAPTRALLTAERTALNFLGHLSGVATLTARWVFEVSGTGVLVRDTRKTVPGLRELDKYAVRCGGGTNHRMGLGDAALIKDNHILSAGGVAQAVAAVRAASPNLPLEVECDSLDQVKIAVACDVALVLLDNMTIERLLEVVEFVRAGHHETKLEASGGLTLDTVRAVAETGVDYVAVGALTHSAPALDLGLDLTDILGKVTK